VVGANDQRGIRVREFGIDFLQVENQVVGYARFRQQYVHVPRHASGNRVDGELDVDVVLLLQHLHEFPQLVLGLSHGQTVTGDDNQRVAVGEGGSSIERLD